jgi:hypothetical protein
MAITASILKRLVARELGGVEDPRVQRHILSSLLVEPEAILRDWDYGRPGQKYVCWSVLNHERSNTGIAYCEDGFGPKHPWGLVQLSGTDAMSMGMDSSWFGTFMEAYFESFAAADLPIWRVFKTSPQSGRVPVSEEQDWDSVWKQIEVLRNEDPESAYDCGHTIKFGPANS